jgi:hypothetical protein
MKLKIEGITWELDETCRSSVWGTGGAPSFLVLAGDNMRSKLCFFFLPQPSCHTSDLIAI